MVTSNVNLLSVYKTKLIRFEIRENHKMCLHNQPSICSVLSLISQLAIPRTDVEILTMLLLNRCINGKWQF